MRTIKLQGLGNFAEYKAFKFPDSSLKVEILEEMPSEVKLEVSFTSNDDILLLGLFVATLKQEGVQRVEVHINYMMYQQDDRKFKKEESFGLKFICGVLNSYPVDKWYIYHPHSDVSAGLLDNCEVIDNSKFITSVLNDIAIAQSRNDIILLSPDAGAAKMIFKLADKIYFAGEVENAIKSREHTTGKLIQRVVRDDFNGKDILIVDDLCLGGNTFIGLAKLLKERSAGQLYLAVSHGVFNNGVDHLLEYFERVYCTDSLDNTNLVLDVIRANPGLILPRFKVYNLDENNPHFR